MADVNGNLFEERGSVSAIPTGQTYGGYTDTQGGPVWQGPLTPITPKRFSLPAQGTWTQYNAIAPLQGTLVTVSWGMITPQSASARLLEITSAAEFHPSPKVQWDMVFQVE